jgi:hypothetical protein
MMKGNLNVQLHNEASYHEWRTPYKAIRFCVRLPHFQVTVDCHVRREYHPLWCLVQSDRQAFSAQRSHSVEGALSKQS